jgi:hypothetical protein
MELQDDIPDLRRQLGNITVTQIRGALLEAAASFSLPGHEV